LALGAHFVITLLAAGSVRNVCQLFELTGLDQFIAASYGAQYSVCGKMEQAIIDFDHRERQRLADSMQPKEIAVCQDETFHPQTCLVAIEPASNFILVEKYADSRKAAEWTEAMKEAVQALPVSIAVSASDEGSGILHHVRSDLGAEHAPDLFHVQHEIVKATSVVLAGKKKMAGERLEMAEQRVQGRLQQKRDYQEQSHGPGRPLDFDRLIEVAVGAREKARRDLETAVCHQQRMKAAIQTISRVYHPVDIETGNLRQADEMSQSLSECFTQIEAVASEANLPERSLKRIRKAKKLVVDMAAVILFYHMHIKAKVQALSLPLKVEQAVLDTLVPGLYVKRLSKQAKSADERRRLRLLSENLLGSLQARDGVFEDLSEQEVKLIEKTGAECADLFQRSSSCVEGRNGQLSLRHHGLHRLSNRKLSALTAVHNYFIKRPDGTTAAERFFGAKPSEMFGFLLNAVDLPGRPARRRT
jgi:hypothetical protein